jgi:hypothetical protein
MTLRAPRFPFSLDPLIAEAKRRARQRRMLIALGVLLVAGLAAGVTFVFRSPGGGSPSGGGLTTASYSQWGVSLRYPAAWTRLDCTTWPAGSLVNPISLLTSARPAPTCPSAATMEFPPPERLGADGAVVFLGHGFALSFKPNASIDGRPALIRPRTVGSAMYVGASSLKAVPCPAGARREYRAAYIKRPGHPNDMFTVAALICGPHFATGDAAVSKLLASMRFASGSK